LKEVAQSTQFLLAVIALLNLLEVAPRPAHLPVIVAAGKGWLAGHPDNLPLTPAEWSVIRRALSSVDAPQFVLVSSSGINPTKEAVGFPVAVCLVWSEAGVPLFEPLLRRLTRHSYRIQPDGFEPISH
jgi:hypothetical protein